MKISFSQKSAIHQLYISSVVFTINSSHCTTPRARSTKSKLFKFTWLSLFPPRPINIITNVEIGCKQTRRVCTMNRLGVFLNAHRELVRFVFTCGILLKTEISREVCATGYPLHLHREGGRGGKGEEVVYVSPSGNTRGSEWNTDVRVVTKTEFCTEGRTEIPTRNNIFLWERKICGRRNRRAVFWPVKNGSPNDLVLIRKSLVRTVWECHWM